MSVTINLQLVYLVNGLEVLSDGKDGLNVVVTQFLNQMSDGRIILWKHRKMTVTPWTLLDSKNPRTLDRANIRKVWSS